MELARSTFIESFSKGNTKLNIDTYLVNNLTQEKLEQELTNSESEFYWIKENHEAIAYLKINMGNAQTEILTLNALEIERIYVQKAFCGRKIGQSLLDKALKIAKSKNNCKFDFK